MTTYVILLRGVMPVGKNKLLMAPLREALSDAGLSDVRTYIQSGNVIASSALAQAELEQLVHDVILQELSPDLTIVARSARKFRQVIEHNPFADADNSRLYFTLLASKPAPAQLREFGSLDFGEDQIRVVKDTIYSLYATKSSDSKFTNNHFERLLKVRATTRNFNTMMKLREMSDDAG